MKLKALFIVLLLIISIKSNDFLDSFSIESFKESLRDNGLFLIIQSIKYAYGQDVAIISCEELNKNYSGNCQKLVTDYMEEKPKINDIDLFFSRNKTFDSQEPTETPENELKEELYYWTTIKNIFDMLESSKKNLNLKELESIYEKIIKRIEKKNLSSTDDFLDFLDSSINNNTKFLN